MPGEAHGSSDSSEVGPGTRLLPESRRMPVIKVDLLNFLIVWAFVLIGRFAANVAAALTHDSPVGQALSLIAA